MSAKGSEIEPALHASIVGAASVISVKEDLWWPIPLGLALLALVAFGLQPFRTMVLENRLFLVLYLIAGISAAIFPKAGYELAFITESWAFGLSALLAALLFGVVSWFYMKPLLPPRALTVGDKVSFFLIGVAFILALGAVLLVV